MTNSAAQRVFNLLDLVEIICEYTSLRGPEGEFLDKSTLRRVVLVNKVARHAASRRLWRNVYGFARILSRIPPFEAQARTMHLSHPESFIFLTEMVQSLHAFDYGDSWDSFHRLEEFVGLLPKGQSIFPNLQDLGLPWSLEGYERAPFQSTRTSTAPIMAIRVPPPPSWTLVLEVLPAHNIRSFSLNLAASNLSHDAAGMVAIGTLLPNLTSLDLSKSPIGPEWAYRIGPAVRTIPHLKELKINVMPAYINVVIADISHLRALRVLQMELNGIGGGDGTEPQDKGGNRRLLLAPLDLVLTGKNNWGQILKVLSALETYCILVGSLSILMVNQTYSENPLEPIARMIATNHPEMTRLSLEYYHPATPERYETTLSCPFHLPVTLLLQLGNIVELDLRVSGSVIICQDTLDTISKQWPRLRHCYFSVEVYALKSDLGRQPVHLADVVQFAANCRDLRTLGIALDARVPSESVEMASVRSMTLNSLDVGSSPIDNGQYAAKVMYDAFPALVDLFWTEDKYPRAWRMSEEERVAWSRVRRAIFWN